MSIEFHFIRPYWLFALILCCIFIILIVKHKLQRGSWTSVCDEDLLPYILQHKPTTQKKGVVISTAIASIITILALAGPTWERLPAPVFRNDSGLVIALDLSRSMLVNDVKPSRLIRAKYKIADILEQRKDGQTALIVYAGDAFTVTPLTTDNATITGQLTALTPEIIPSSGSNTALALEQAVNLFKQAGLQKGHILLITDGVNLADNLRFIKEFSRYQLSILAVGTKNGAPIQLPQGGFLKDKQGNIVIPKLLLNELQQLATVGNGDLQIISDDDSDIKSLLNTINNSVKNTTNEIQEDFLLEQWDDKGAWLLLLVLPLVAVNFRRGLLTLTFLLVLPFPKNSYAFEWQDLWETNNQQAQKMYQQQDFSAAAESFNDPNWKAISQYKAGQYDKVLETLKNEKTADSFYNQGNALAKNGKLSEAIKSYEQALKIDANNEDSLYNKKLVEDALEKQKKQKKQKKKQDQQQQDKNQDSKKSKDNKEEDTKKSESSKDKKDDDEKESSSKDTKNKEDTKKTEEEQRADEKSGQDDQAKKESEPEKEQPNKQSEQVAPASPIDETKQADAQWLNRIPDDPAGLLRRKFQYQYKLRKRNEDKNAPTW